MKVSVVSRLLRAATMNASDKSPPNVAIIESGLPPSLFYCSRILSVAGNDEACATFVTFPIPAESISLRGGSFLRSIQGKWRSQQGVGRYIPHCIKVCIIMYGSAVRKHVQGFCSPQDHDNDLHAWYTSCG